MEVSLRRATDPIPYVLIVDDSATARRLIERAVTHAGYEAGESDSGEACLAMIANRRPDVILLDVQLVGMSGLDVTRKIRESFTHLELPILLVTNHIGDDHMVSGFSAGANDYLTKPVNRRVLLARLEAQLSVVLSRRHLKEAEALIALNVKLESIHTFVLGITHVFNNIFGTMRGTLELIKRREVDEKTTLLLDLLVTALERGISFTKRIAGMAQEVKSPEGADAREVIHQIVELQRELLQSNTKIDSEVESQLHRVNLGDISLGNLLTNLVHNAVEACSHGGEVLITAKNVEGFVEFTVKDTGEGMSGEVKARVFEPFFSTKSLDHINGVSTLGRGLGLWNVFNLVKSVGGLIGVDSEEGKGTSVVFTLPIVRGRVEEGKKQ